MSYVRRCSGLALVLLAASVSACSGGSSSPQAPPVVSSASATTSGLSVQAQAIVDWYSAVGRREFHVIASDLLHVGRAGKQVAISRNLSGLAIACLKVNRDVGRLQRQTAPPDPSIAVPLSHALELMGQGASDCFSGAMSKDLSLVRVGAREISRAGDFAGRAKRAS